MKALLRVFLLAASVLMLCSPAMADYPERTVTLIVPFSAGGGTDSVARVFAPLLADALDANVIVKNVDGASGTLGTAEAAKAKPDGYTLGFIPIGPMTCQPNLRNLPYSIDSFDAIANVTLSPVLFYTAKSAKWNSMQEVIADLKANPGKYLYGSSGPGGMPHVALAATMEALGVDVKHMPDKGTGPAMKSLASGVIQFYADTPPILQQYDVKALAAFTEERIPSLPDVPTMKELGYDLQFSVWRGIFAPKGTSPEIIEKVAAASKKAVESPKFQEMAKKLKTDPKYMGPQEFSKFVASEFTKNGKILESAGLKK
ncbi:Bug family tripartite tricarboxylate transporter substrate binding protein [Oceanidesulfovibrio marinus]|uniref:Tripartite tricarboxylate transporter substrate binding protein n=1 Tax=Oceanidesulfovibrio marinus TaxID=370038 RepID=A0A6P1ZLY0_9BACT|nr:tripartite tricarboxylate transporter substrate binding protein [Oceanidesulfovibrio marinus]QJT08791.1 tripartite tricarboxylate transporter substrate binding protein [Oceanidesulfovibrio marinus]TVM36782.1 tripartite tricarboxylate transporter substrate binding protein [Oceanidesulfovibrio marinus]